MSNQDKCFSIFEASALIALCLHRVWAGCSWYAIYHPPYTTSTVAVSGCQSSQNVAWKTQVDEK